MAIEEQYRVVAGYRTHYVVAGEGAPVILVHGVGGSLLMYQKNIEELARVARVYALDLPGHGQSEIADTEYSAENGGAFVCSFIEEVCGEPVALVGLSAGGLMCAIAAGERPDLITRLVLVSSAGFGRDIGWTLRLLTLPLLDRFIEEATPDRVRGSLQRQVYDSASITPEFVDEVYQGWQRPGNRRAFVKSLRTNISLFGVRRWRRHLRRVSVLALPVMIIWGKNDHTIPVKHAYRAAKRIAGSKLHVLEHCGHMPPYERSIEFNRLVREFLRLIGAEAGMVDVHSSSHTPCASVLEHIGDTPLVELKHFDLKSGVRLFAKLEGQNPTGSVKDRIVRQMLLVARRQGQIEPGSTIVEATTGNTGIALAMIGRQLGYTVKVVVPENVFPEIGDLLRVYGAEIIWVPSDLGIKRAMDLARELAKERGWFILDQFANEENSRAHYEGTGQILADLPKIDIFVAGLGTGGTIMGTGRRLKEANPATKVVAVEPHPGNQVQGLKSLNDGYIPPILDMHMLDGKVLARSRHAFEHSYELIRREGIFGGVSSGAVLHAALKFARRIERGNIVCLFADAGWKYLGTSIWKAEPATHHDDDNMDDVIWW